MPKRIAVLTTGRQDWGILRSTCAGLAADMEFDLRLFVGGMHLSERFGRPVQWIEREGFTPAERIEWTQFDSVFDEAAIAIRDLGPALARHRPDAFVLAGDRYETAAGALAATLARVPIAHLHGGEETEGAFDNAFRHAVTKLSHLHLVSHVEHARRVVRLGEDPSTVHVVGAPGLDNAWRADLPSRAELGESLGSSLAPPVVVVTVHPATLATDPDADVDAVLQAMEAVEATYIVTLPNSDPGNARFRERLLASVRGHARRVSVEALGERRFWGLLRAADAMLGNSSSALIEAPLFGVPAVNVGIRQKGRLRGRNVIDASVAEEAIAALKTALTPEFRKQAGEGESPFGDGHSAQKILAVLRSWTPPHPPVKRPVPTAGPAWPAPFGEGERGGDR